MSLMLERIQSPKDLRGLSMTELKALAAEMREVIIRQVANHGGHLASNLGTVELTLALHTVYNTPTDKLVWDVGHQAYPHKLVTGRYKDFHTLKQFGGISGFLKRSESEYDCFGAGHASTSLAAALGFAAARTLRKENHEIVGIIGDGSLTGGMAFEALNNAGEINEKIVFVLNDNKMSIDHNVGAISKYLNRIISNPLYNKLKEEVWHLADRLPTGMGKGLQKIVSRVDESVKGLVLPGTLFEELGIRYFGPIDGHKLEDLVEIFESVKKLHGPVIVHVVTTKGFGWEKSEEDAIKWHASVPFHLESGKPKSAPAATPSFTKVFGDALLEIARSDEKVIAVTGAMPDGCGVNVMAKEFPKRVYDVGIAEEYAVTFAAGAACGGLKPVVAIYSTFLQRAIDQIIHDVALQHLPVIFALDRGGLVGADGPTHHGTFDLTYLRMIPDMVFMAPSDEIELRNMLYTAYKYEKGPTALRYPRGNAFALDTHPAFEEIPLGLPKMVQSGEKILIIAVGQMLFHAKKAVAQLEAEGKKPTLLDARFIRPLNKQFYQELFQSHQAVVTIEDNVKTGGFGSGISELMAELEIENTPIKHLALPDEFVTHGEIPVLYKMLGLDSDGIYKAISELYGKLG